LFPFFSNTEEPMLAIRPGFEMSDPITQTRIVVVKGAEETSGRGWVTEVYCPQGATRFPAHVHETWTETFEILEGSATCRIGAEEHRLACGESIFMPARVPHVHPWNTGSGEMVFRHANDFGAPDPEAVTDVLGAYATMFGLAREGRVGKRGLPKNPLQLAATARTLTKHRGFDAAVPIPIQLALSATLGRLAEALGYRGVYERYLS
jgi:mannose-6-phosphate isomerase-like protein (cupin superfamily)